MTSAAADKTINEYADFWRYSIGVNVIPADTRNKVPLIKWSQWQNKPIPQELHNKWKSENVYSKGMAIILGKIWHRTDRLEYYLIGVDCDNALAIKEICTNGVTGKVTSLEQFAKTSFVEQHNDNPHKAHIYIYAPRPIPGKSSDRSKKESTSSEVPAIEVKSIGKHGIFFCSPSINIGGQPYEIMGTNAPVVLTEQQANEFELHIDNICRKYGIKYLDTENGKSKSSIAIYDLFREDAKIYEGHNRHEALLRVMESLLARNKGVLTLDQIKSFSREWNQKHCLPQLRDSEVERQWQDAVDFIERNTVRQKEESKEEEEFRSISEKLLEIVKSEQMFLFKDQYGVPYAQIIIVNNGSEKSYANDLNGQNHKHREIVKVESNKFRRYLYHIFNKRTGKIPNSEAVVNVVNILQAQAEFEQDVIPLELRTASTGTGTIFWYDMTDEQRNVIKISKDGWQIVDSFNAPILFSRYNEKPQTIPVREYPDDVFDQFINLGNLKNKKEDALLVKVYIITQFIPSITRVVLILHGEQGAAKSYLAKLKKRLVDPSKPELLTLSKDRNEFIQQVNHNYLSYYDNIKKVPYWLSNEACIASTGGGSTKRKLYTDDEDIVYEHMRSLGFTGINAALSEPDALDRSILIELERIKPTERKTEKFDLDPAFDAIKGQVLGYIFDTLVKAMQIRPTIVLNSVSRMADFEYWGEAISRAMGYKPMDFVDAYRANREKQNATVIESNQLATTVVEFCKNQIDNNEDRNTPKEWEGSLIELLDNLELLLPADKRNSITRQREWPKSAGSLSRKLRVIRSNLLDGLGFEIQFKRATTEEDIKKYCVTKGISLVKISKISSLSSLPHYMEHHAQNDGNNNVGIGEDI